TRTVPLEPAPSAGDNLAAGAISAMTPVRSPRCQCDLRHVDAASLRVAREAPHCWPIACNSLLWETIMKWTLPTLLGIIMLSGCGGSDAPPDEPASQHAPVTAPSLTTPGPLRVLASNPRYFTDGTGKAVYLVGSHTWSNGMEDRGTINPPPAFDYSGYISFMA